MYKSQINLTSNLKKKYIGQTYLIKGILGFFPKDKMKSVFEIPEHQIIILFFPLPELTDMFETDQAHSLYTQPRSYCHIIPYYIYNPVSLLSLFFPGTTLPHS